MAATRMPANERKALMLEAAVRVFARVGYAAATTDSIAREAGVSRAFLPVEGNTFRGSCYVCC